MGSRTRHATRPWWRGLAAALTLGVAMAWAPAAAAAGPGDAGSSGANVQVSSSRLLEGTQYETPMTVIQASQPGPVVLAVGGVHGDDPAGVRAGEALAALRDLRKGTLMVIPALNRPAVEAGRRSVDVDLNRAFPQSAGAAPSDPRARAVWDVMQQYRVDYLVDMHEDTRPWTESDDIGNVLIFRRVGSNEAMANRLLAALNAGVSSSQRWRLGGEPIRTGLVRSAQDVLGVNGFYVSTATTNAMEVRVGQHRTAVLTLLQALAMIGTDDELPDDGDTPPPPDDGDTPPDDGNPPPNDNPPPDDGNPPDEPPAPPSDGNDGDNGAPGGNRVTVRTLLQGTRFETELYVIDSGRPGPTVWISGGVHGSELAGWQAAEQIAHWRVARGRLLVLPHANALAVEQRRRAASGYGDLNREFPTDGDSTPDSQVASAIWDELRRYRPDWVLDLHEALGNRNQDSNSVGQTMIVWPSGEMVAMAQTVIGRINAGLSSTLDFRMLRYPVNGSLARAAGEQLGLNAAIVETSRKYELSNRIDWHLRIVRYLLEELDMDPVTTQSSSRTMGDSGRLVA